jgi:hypothetical protein
MLFRISGTLYTTFPIAVQLHLNSSLIDTLEISLSCLSAVSMLLGNDTAIVPVEKFKTHEERETQLHNGSLHGIRPLSH